MVDAAETSTQPSTPFARISGRASRDRSLRKEPSVRASSRASRFAPSPGSRNACGYRCDACLFAVVPDLENPEARQEAAISGELRSRAEPRPGACEKGREFGDLPGVTEASKGHWFGELAVHFLNTPSISIRLCKVFLHRRDDRPRADRVCANVVLGQVHGQSVGKRNEGAFRSRIGADAGRVR